LPQSSDIIWPVTTTLAHSDAVWGGRQPIHLADTERDFRVLKSYIEIAPVHHRLPDRIRAHALICFLALVLYASCVCA